MEVFKRAANVFVSPDQCFLSIEEKKKNWLDYFIPILLLVVMAFISTNLTTDLVKDVQMDTIQKMQQLTDAQKQAAIERMDAPIANTMKYVSIVLMIPISALFTAAVFLMMGNFVGGGKQTFGKMFLAALMIQLITIPESIIKLVMMLQKESMQVYLGLASFFSSPDMASFGFQFAAQFEFFKIWRIILWIAAFKYLYKYDTKKASWLVLIVMILGMLIAAFMASSQMAAM